MSIDRRLLSEFVKITNDEKQEKPDNVYGTVVVQGDTKYIKMDGSDILTPMYTTTDIKENERVMVEVKNHRATVTGNLSNPSAGNDRVESAEGAIGKFDHLFAGNITADNIKAGTITADKIMAGTITADKIQTGTITAGSGVIADGAIGNAQISTLDASKVTAGTIDTSNVTIAGANGNLKMKGNRIQVFQGIGVDQFERVSIGDVNADGTTYGLRVRGADGETVLLDENGVTQEGITDGSITNDKINPDAGIEGGKLDIDSVIDTINADGSKTINSVRIDVDGMGLSAVVQEIKDKTDETNTNVATNTAEIIANANSIKMKVDEQIYQTDKENMTTQMGKNTTAIDLLKGEMSLKVEQIDIENAINAEGEVTSSKIESVKSEIKLTTDAITSKVESVETKTNKNLLMNTNFASNTDKTEDWNLWTDAGDAGGWYKHQSTTFPTGEGIGVFIQLPDKYGEIQSKPIRVARGEKYTLSADILVEHNLRDAQVYFREFDKNGNWTDHPKGYIPSGYGGRKTWTHTIVGENTNALQIIFINRGAKQNTTSYVVLFINRVQLEKGDTATNWALSAGDTMGSKFSEIKQTTDGITSTVSNVQNDVNGIQSAHSQLTQKVDGFEFNVKSSSAYNLFRNSGFRNGTQHWRIHQYNNPSGSYHLNNCYNEWGFPDSDVNTWVLKLSNQADKEYGICQYINTTKGRTYTISFYHAGHRLSGANVIVRDNTGWIANKDFDPNAPGGNQSVNNWKKQTLTFVATDVQHRIDIVINSAQNDGYMWIAKPMVNDGPIAYQHSFRSEEIYRGVTTIDEVGVKVTHDGGDYSQMTSQGFKRHRSGGELKGDYHYLLHQGTVFCNSEQTIRVHLPADFHWKKINAVAAAACIGTGTDAHDKPEPLVSFWAEVSNISPNSDWVDFYASTRQNKNGQILTQHKGIKFAYWITA